jgi:hypothetical protein
LRSALHDLELDDPDAPSDLLVSHGQQKDDDQQHVEKEQ